MTFTEAAVEILRREGKPLHYKSICEVALKENLLSHVGQTPEATMGARLAAMAKREEDRRIIAVAAGTFALVEWAIPADPAAAEVAPEPTPDEGAAARPKERHPRPMSEVRAHREESQAEAKAERQQGRERERDRGRGRGRRYPPPAEVAWELVAQKKAPMTLAELVAALVEKDLVEARFGTEPGALSEALVEDNKKRTDAGRDAQFVLTDGEGGASVGLTVYPEVPPPPREPRERDRDRGREREPARAEPVAQTGTHPHGRPVVPEPRRNALRELRRRLMDADLGVLERLTQALLEKHGFRDVRIAKRSKDGPLYTARRRLGIVDVRFAIRLLKGGRELSRQDIQDVRKDLSHYSAQLGAIVTPSEVHRDARGDASAAGQATVFVYAGDAFAEELANAGVGVIPTFVVDDALFAAPLGERELRGPARASPSLNEAAAPSEKPAEAAVAAVVTVVTTEVVVATVETPAAAAPAPSEGDAPAGEKPADGSGAAEPEATPGPSGSWLGRVFKGLTK